MLPPEKIAGDALYIFRLDACTRLKIPDLESVAVGNVKYHKGKISNKNTHMQETDESQIYNMTKTSSARHRMGLAFISHVHFLGGHNIKCDV